MASLAFHIEVDWAARHGIRHIVVEEAEHSRKAAEEGGVVDSHIHLGVEVGRSSGVGSSLAGAGTAVVVEVLHILLRGIQIQDRLTFLLDDAIEKKIPQVAGWYRPDAERRFRTLR